jgi:hypothetical protein
VDLLHPRQFTKIYEITPGGDTIAILTQRSDDHAVVLRTDYEVDRRSDVHVSFDRRWMASKPGLEADVLVTGKLFHDKKEQDLQIPGYHVIGTDAGPNPVRVRSSAEMHSILREMAEESGVVAQTTLTLAEGRTRLTSTGDRQLAYLLTSLNSMRSQLVQLTTRSEGGDSLDDPLISESVQARLQELRERSDSLARLLEGQAGILEYVNEATRRIQEAGNELVPVLNRFTSEENSSVLRAVAQVSNRDYSIPLGTARRVSQRIQTLAAAAPLRAGSRREEIRSRLQEVEEIERALSVLKRFAERVPQDDDSRTRMNLLLLGSLKDADVLLANTVASTGDDVSLTVYNFRNDAQRTRSMDIRLHVREFGWVRKISDSYMFFRRAGLDREYRRNIEADSAAADLRAQSTGQSAEYSRTMPLNFEPALGVSLGWTYYPRSDPKPLTQFLRWVQPGAGINVSFPRFATRTVTVSRGDPANAASPLQRKATDNRPQIGLGSGIVLSVFDGALQYSYGYSLVSDSKRRYHALGFSFFEVAKRLAEAAGS